MKLFTFTVPCMVCSDRVDLNEFKDHLVNIHSKEELEEHGVKVTVIYDDKSKKQIYLNPA